MRRIIGLTGGIGMGKTTVADYLAQAYELPILDADVYAREAVEQGSIILDAIALRYGKKILLDNGTLNRRRLGEIVFSDAEEREWLEQQIHPYVRSRFQSELNTLTANTVVLVIPLLFEAQMTDLVTEIWVVWSSPEQQLQRLMKREFLTREQAKARISSQMPIEDKMAAANVILENNSTREALLEQVDVAMSSHAF